MADIAALATPTESLLNWCVATHQKAAPSSDVTTAVPTIEAALLSSDRLASTAARTRASISPIHRLTVCAET